MAGRPRISGPNMSIRFPLDVQAHLEERAAAKGESTRAYVIRTMTQALRASMPAAEPAEPPKIKRRAKP